MNDNRWHDRADGVGLALGLWELREVRAPETLLPMVLARIGVADQYFPLDTPIGTVFVAYSARGVAAVMRAATGHEFEQSFQHIFGRSIRPATEPPAALQRAIRCHLQGTRVDLRFDLRGLSEFEQAVLRKALEIPRGEVRPYAWIAREIGSPRAVRAVGSALARNPIPLLIPCHRVVRSDGVIGNYGLGGPVNKKAILAWEGLRAEEIEELAKRGIRYLGSETTGIYCYPTCRNARRITGPHRKTFHSESEADAAGFRPCRVCRPMAYVAAAN